MDNPSSATATVNPDRKIAILIVVSLLALTAIAYHPLRECHFTNYDDPGYVTSNYQVEQGLTLGGVYWAFTSLEFFNWHPLTWLSHMADVQLFKMDAAKHHLTSLLFHLINIGLLFVLVNRITGAKWRSALVAALFALHPVNVESVAWISERKNVLSTFFLLLAIWLYVSYAQKVSLRNYLLVVLAFALGLMSKPMLVTLPCVLLLLDVWPLRRLRVPRLQACREINRTDRIQKSTPVLVLLEKIPLLLLSILSSLITLKAQSAGMPAALPLGVALKNATVSYAVYIKRMVWPVDLSVIYPFRGSELPAWQVISSILVLLACTVIAIFQLRNRPYLAIGWFWYIGTLVPVIGIVQVGIQANADRYNYVPLIGIFIITAWALGELVESTPISKPFLIAACFACLLGLGAATNTQVGYWRNSTTLFQHAVKVTQNNDMAYGFLGSALEEKGDQLGAWHNYFSALQSNPTLGLRLLRIEFPPAALSQPNSIDADAKAANASRSQAGQGRTE